MSVIFVLIITIVILPSYFFIRPYLKTKESRQRVFKIVIFLAPAPIIGYCIVTYLDSKPESFTEGVELLKKNNTVSAKIGDFESYTYFDKDLPNKNDNPAAFKVELNGSSANIYVKCVVIKNKNSVWALKSIEQDSLIKRDTSKD